MSSRSRAGPARSDELIHVRNVQRLPALILGMLFCSRYTEYSAPIRGRAGLLLLQHVHRGQCAEGDAAGARAQAFHLAVRRHSILPPARCPEIAFMSALTSPLSALAAFRIQ